MKYFERILTYFNGEDQPGRRYTSYFLPISSSTIFYLSCLDLEILQIQLLFLSCTATFLFSLYQPSVHCLEQHFYRCMLRGFRIHRCPYWIRPSITVSNHNGVLLCFVLCVFFNNQMFFIYSRRVYAYLFSSLISKLKTDGVQLLCSMWQIIRFHCMHNLIIISCIVVNNYA